MTHRRSSAAVALGILMTLLAQASSAFSIQCFQGPNPWAVPYQSDPTVWATTSWDSWDLITMDIVWMNSIAFGRGCEPSCVLLLPETAFAPASAYPDHKRTQSLNVFVGGTYTLNSEAQGFNDHQIPQTQINACTIIGLVAPIRFGDR